MSGPAVALTDVGVQIEKVKRKRRRHARLPTIGGAETRRQVWVFRSVTLTIRPGECVALIDPTGKRVKPLMRIVTGLLPPDEGTVVGPERGLLLTPPHRRATKALSIGQSLRMLGGLYGLSDVELDSRFGEAVEFAGVRRQLSRPSEEASKEVIHQLAFAIATRAPVDVLAFERMALVGSPPFRAKCLPRLSDLLTQGVALVLATSDGRLIESLAARTLLLERSGVRELDPTETTTVLRQQADRQRQERAARRRASRRVDDDDDD